MRNAMLTFYNNGHFSILKKKIFFLDSLPTYWDFESQSIGLYLTTTTEIIKPQWALSVWRYGVV